MKAPLRPVRLRKKDTAAVDTELAAVPHIEELCISPLAKTEPIIADVEPEDQTSPPVSDTSKKKGKVEKARRQDSISPPLPSSPPNKRRRPLPNQPVEKPKKSKAEKAKPEPVVKPPATKQADTKPKDVAPSLPPPPLPPPRPVLDQPVKKPAVVKGPAWKPPGKRITFFFFLQLNFCVAKVLFAHQQRSTAHRRALSRSSILLLPLDCGWAYRATAASQSRFTQMSK